MNPEKLPTESPSPLEQKPQGNTSFLVGNAVEQEKKPIDTSERVTQDDAAIAEIKKQLGITVEVTEPRLEKGIILNSTYLKEKLLDSLELVFNSLGISVYGDLEKKTATEITNKYRSLNEFSNEAGDYFMRLIPNGLNKPEIEGSDRKNDRDDSFAKREAGAFNPAGLVNRKNLKLNLKNFFDDSIFRKNKVTYSGELKEQILSNSHTVQEITRAMNQGVGPNIIYEHIENEIYSDESRRTRAGLVLQDTESGLTLDLNELLPENFHFQPGLNDLDLKTYQGALGSEGSFYEHARSGVVAYGDITKKGEMLSLFHEIAHSWQANYSKDALKGKYTYNKLIEESYRLMQDFSETKDLLSTESTQSNEGAKEECLKKIEKIFKDLSNIGTELVVKNNQVLAAIEDPVDEDRVINLQYILNNTDPSVYDSWEITQEKKEELRKKKYFPIRNSKLEKARENYIAEERDAWAHALRMMRFLKNSGLDIEPELKKLSDFKEHIDPCLGSYQKSLKGKIKLTPDDYRFSRLPQQ